MPSRPLASRKRPHPISRGLKPLLFVAWLLPFAWLVFRAATHTPHAAEWAVCVTLVALLVAWRILVAMRPRQRVQTWRKPRGIDLIRRTK